MQILTIGQYLRPTESHLQMVRYYHPDEFAELKRIALDLGFGHVESGPLVRSSYHAHEQADALIAAKNSRNDDCRLTIADCLKAIRLFVNRHSSMPVVHSLMRIFRRTSSSRAHHSTGQHRD